jgi:hypothetical protein
MVAHDRHERDRDAFLDHARGSLFDGFDDDDQRRGWRRVDVVAQFAHPAREQNADVRFLQPACGLNGLLYPPGQRSIIEGDVERDVPC